MKEDFSEKQEDKRDEKEEEICIKFNKKLMKIKRVSITVTDCPPLSINFGVNL